MFRRKRKYFVSVQWDRHNPADKDSYTFNSDKERQAFIDGLYEARKHHGAEFAITREGYYDE